MLWFVDLLTVSFGHCCTYVVVNLCVKIIEVTFVFISKRTSINVKCEHKFSEQ